MTDPNDDMLDDLFGQARNVAPEPSEALVARVLADAAAVRHAAATPKPTLLDRFFDMIGGWPAAGGLVAATLGGLWIGVAPPASVEDFTAAMLGEQVAVGILSSDTVFDMDPLADG
ncbi:hypothetical protein SLH49_08605 [Cognatiyoonia sp. IB215446]|uniref:hypothetical protein n=1 Tax=Cognatiyoonia sp. IB215446 TaxID=3097355 RepID=UPI002A13C90E|nr:hypothetical protein [Cognatiyoonia sp. IB215446]MDX8348045.1 hypothetical protein [Cognatiyoonia sp. IB215446]